MAPADGDAGTGVPQSAAHARLDDRTFGVVAANHGVGMDAVGASLLGLADEPLAQFGRVARHRIRRSVGVGDGRRDADCVRKIVLDALQFFAAEKILERDRQAVERLRQRNDALFYQLLRVLALGDIRNDADDAALAAISVENPLAGQVAPELGLIGAPIKAFVLDFGERLREQVKNSALRRVLFGRMNQAAVVGALKVCRRPAEHLGHALIGLDDTALLVEQENGDAGSIENLPEQRLAALQHRVGFGQFARALGDLRFERLVELGQHLRRFHLPQPVQADLGEDSGQLRKEDRCRFDIFDTPARNALDRLQVGGFVVAEVLCLAAEELDVRRLGQHLPGKDAGQVFAFDDDRRGGIDQPVRTAENDKRRLAARVVE